MSPVPGSVSPAMKLRLNRGALSSKAAANCPAPWVMRKPIKKFGVVTVVGGIGVWINVSVP